jgi:ABC-type transport system substrate-binding protein
LVQYNGSDLIHVVPAIASNWSASSDYRTWTFTIRQHVHFSNGDPVNAFTGWFSWERGYLINAPPAPYVSNYPNLLQNISYSCTGTLSNPRSCVGEEGNSHSPANTVIWGTRQAVAGAFGVPVSNENQVIHDLLNVLDNFNPANSTQLAVMENPNQGIQVVDNDTLRFNLLQPYSDFLLILPPQWGAFVDPTWVDSPANCGGVVNNTECTNFSVKGGPGTGPYEYGRIGPNNQQVVLVSNPSYWAEGTPEAALCSQPGDISCAPVLRTAQISTIVMNFGTPTDTTVNAFDTDVAQLTFVGIPQFNQLLRSYNYSGIGFDQLFHDLGYPLEDLPFGLNGAIFPTNIADFRLAIVHAVNYSEINLELYTYDGKQLGLLFQPPVPPGWGPLDNPDKIQLYPYNPSLAAQYLNSSGWEGDFHTFTTVRIGDLPVNTTLGNPKGPWLPQISLYTIPPLTNDSEVEDGIIAAGLAQIGIRVNVVLIFPCDYGCPEATNSYLADANIEGAGWAADWPDAILQEFAPMAVPDVAYELSASVTNSTLLSLLNRIPYETNPAEQIHDSATAWAMYSQLAGILQLPLPENYVFAQPYVAGIFYNPFEFAYYYNLMYYTP